VPFRVLGSAARTDASSAPVRPRQVSCPFRVTVRQSIARSGSAIPLCRWPFLGCVVFLRRTTLVTVKRTANPLVELGLLSSLTQQNLAGQPQPASPSHGLPLPTAHEESRVHHSRALPARFVPPSGFGYPRDGLLPAVPRRFCLTPAALLGFTLRSFLLSEGFQPVSGMEGPTYCFAWRYTQHRSAGPARQAAVPGVQILPGVPGDRHVFSTPPAGCSLGFSPSRVLRRPP